MRYNLIEECWIPVEHESGMKTMIAPWDLIDETDPIVGVSFDRPDFNSAVTQFLIGLVQTVVNPRTEDDWMNMIENGVYDLKEKMRALHLAFEMFGEERRFMQDVAVSTDDVQSISSLIHTNPVENTLKKNIDIFTKRVESFALCPSCAAAALITNQMFAPSGGRGYRTSIRGSSAMTTMLVGKSLWNTICLNVMEMQYLEHIGPGCDPNASPFPWMDDVSDNQIIDHAGRNVLTVYWATPRRVLFGPITNGKCNVCGSGPYVVETYYRCNRGNNYGPQWIHPLSPYRMKDGKLINEKMARYYSQYRFWVGAIYEKTIDSIEPALVVKHAENQKDFLSSLGFDHYRIWISGYEFDNMSPMNYLDSVFPVMIVDDCMIDDLSVMIRRLLVISSKAVDALYKAMRFVRRNNKSDNNILDRFWTDTEDTFNFSIKKCVEMKDFQTIIDDWISIVEKEVFYLFDEFCDAVDLSDYECVSIARCKLSKKLSKKNMMKVVSQ